MENVRLIHSVDRPSDLKSIVRQDLISEFGIKAPKIKNKKSKRLNQSRSSTQQQDTLTSGSIFGNYLSFVPSKYVSDCGFVPRFLTDAAEVIEDQSKMEGIFRKSGSINRQKELRQDIEEDRGLQSSNVHDVTALVKQFFRELPDPLFTSIYHDLFVRCYNLPPTERMEALLLMCLLLPIEHLSTLRFTMGMLSQVAAHSAHNKMDAGNLAVVLAPNIMYVNGRSQKMNSSEEKLLHVQTAIVKLLIQHADRIGVVSNSLFERTNLLGECFGTEDELDGASDDNTLEDSKDNRKKRRKRSSSLQGLVSSIGRGLSRLRRNSDGKSNVTAGSNYSLSNDSELASHSQMQPTSVAGSQEEVHKQEELGMPAATPVLRKRKNSGEGVPFSAIKRKAILDQLPYRSALGATPFTPASTKKKHPHDMKDLGLMTPNIPYQERPRSAFSPTPKQDKSMRKKLNLFSPSSNRKSKRCKVGGSGNLSCSNPLRKSSKTKHLFKRLSSGKDKDGGDSLATTTNSDCQASPPGVPHSESAVELSNRDQSSRSPRGISRSVSSPSLHDTSAPNLQGDITLNQGFIDPDMTFGLDTTSNTTSSTGSNSPTRGRSLKRTESFQPKPVRRSASIEGALRRGQPNKLSNGLMDGNQENVKKLRRSFDKSDISKPIPYIVPTLPERHDSDGKEPASRFAQHRLVPERRHTVVVEANTPASNNADTSVAPDLMESSLMNVVIPPPASFADQSMMQVDIEEDKEHGGAGSDGESEAGFSTISGGTVIFKPTAELQSLEKGKTGPGVSRDMAYYGSSVSVNTYAKPLSLQPSTSVDSLISTESEASTTSSINNHRGMDRSISTDSGKGSLLDGAEDREGGSSRALNKTFVKSRELDTRSLQSEDGMASDVQGSSRSIKCLSAEDLKHRPKEKPASRCHSMYVSGSGRHGNIVPNLQISAETHRLLNRAGFLESSAPPTAKDVPLPFKSPQRADGSSHNFSHDEPLGRSFRLERSATFRKDRPSSHHCERVSPVKEEISVDQAELMKGSALASAAKNTEEAMEQEEVWVRRGPTTEETKLRNPGPSHSHSHTAEEKMDAPRSLNLKRAEMRIQKHDSVVKIKENKAGHVAQNVHTINSSLDHSALDKSSNNSLNFSLSTTRKRGTSPVRIPSIFNKSQNDASTQYFRELAQSEHTVPKLKREPKVTESCRSEREQEMKQCQNLTNIEVRHPGHNLPSSGEGMNHAPGESFRHLKQRELARQPHDVHIDLSSSLMNAIEDVVTPRSKKRSSHQAESSRSPLLESTNTKPTSGLTTELLQLRTSKGLTPHQVGRFGPKSAASDRSPGKPVKRLQSPRSPHGGYSPQRPIEKDSLRLESHNFHEQY